MATPIPAEKLTELDAKDWELYHVAEDFAENHNLAEMNLESAVGGPGHVAERRARRRRKVRAKLIELIGMWYVEAGKYNVLPVDGRGVQRFAEERPQIAVGPHQLHLLSRAPSPCPPTPGRAC